VCGPAAAATARSDVVKVLYRIISAAFHQANFSLVARARGGPFAAPPFWPPAGRPPNNKAPRSTLAAGRRQTGPIQPARRGSSFRPLMANAGANCCVTARSIQDGPKMDTETRRRPGALANRHPAPAVRHHFIMSEQALAGLLDEWGPAHTLGRPPSRGARPGRCGGAPPPGGAHRGPQTGQIGGRQTIEIRWNCCQKELFFARRRRPLSAAAYPFQFSSPRQTRRPRGSRAPPARPARLGAISTRSRSDANQELDYMRARGRASARDRRTGWQARLLARPV
jgi:hypothetical protein